MTKSHLQRHHENLNSHKIQLISFMSLIMGFGNALLAYILSSYFKEALGTDNVSIVFLVSYLVILVALLNLHKIIRKFGKSVVFFISFIIKIIALTFLIALPVSFWGIWILVLYIIFGNLGWVTLDVILESFSEDKSSGRIRGLYLSIMNAGFIFGPFISTQVLEKFDFAGVFFVSLLINSTVFVIALIGFKEVNHSHKKSITVKKLLHIVFHRRNVMKAYYISFSLAFFYALMVIYTPLHLLSLGISWEKIGFIFTIMLIPFTIFQYPIGVLADKKMGEKELIIFALLLTSISTAALFFVESTSVLVWGAVLFVTRIGASFLEVLRDSYFYKRIDGFDVDLIDFYRTSKPVAFVVAAGISGLFLLVFSLKAIFILVALVTFSALYPAFKLEDNKSEKELKTV